MAEGNRACPHCGLCDVHILIVGRAGSAGAGMGWRCHACGGDWTDDQLRLLRPSWARTS
jgi:transposase-like protein